MKTTDAMENLLDTVHAEGRVPAKFAVREDDWHDVLEKADGKFAEGDPAQPLPRSYLGIPVEFAKLHENELAAIYFENGERKALEQ